MTSSQTSVDSPFNAFSTAEEVMAGIARVVLPSMVYESAGVTVSVWAAVLFLIV